MYAPCLFFSLPPFTRGPTGGVEFRPQPALDSGRLRSWGGAIQDESWDRCLRTLDRRDRH